MLGHDVDTQDFIFATGTTFPSDTAVLMPKASRAPSPAWYATCHELDTESVKVDFFGHPLADSSFRQCLIRYGDHVARLGAGQVSPTQAALQDGGSIHTPKQKAYSAGRVRYFNDVMTFPSTHSLAAHRPLGSIMRARMQVYRSLSAFRHRENGIAEENTNDIDRVSA